MRQASRALLTDCRGAILVLGILLGAMLVSIVFHIASVGQAILWRENAQDAADAVAYEAALWNARGMNVIVALNIFLAVLIAILMFWRLLMLVVTIMLVLSGIACALTPFIPVLGNLCRMTPRLANIVSKMVRYDQRYSPKLYRAMTLIHRSQVIVASATPIISAVRSSTHVMNDEQYSNVKVALGVGFQLTPYFLYPDSPELQDSPPRMPCGVTAADRKADLSGKIMGKPVSLPMMHWYELDELCGKGATMQTKIADAVLQRMAGLLGFGELAGVFSGGKFADVWSFIAEIMSPVLCESIEGSVQERFEEVIDRACEKAKDRSQCEQDYRDESARSGTDKVDKPKLGGPSSDDVLYAKTYWLATNGNLFMQSWGLVLAERPLLESADKLIKFSDRWSKGGATPGGGGSALPSVTAKPVEIESEAWVVAGAEMFFDCQKGWADCRYSSMWAMNWRARLRRFHDPMEYGSGLVETAIVESLWGGIDKALAGGPLGGLIQKATGGSKLGGTLVGRFGGSQLHGFILSLARQEFTERGRSTTYEHGGIRSASSWALGQLQDSGRDEIIH